MEAWIIVVFSSLGVFLLVCLYLIRNLIRKNLVYENMVLTYSEYISKLSAIVELSDVKLKELDDTGVFKSDDEIGFFFDNVKELQSILNDFIVKEK